MNFSLRIMSCQDPFPQPYPGAGLRGKKKKHIYTYGIYMHIYWTNFTMYFSFGASAKLEQKSKKEILAWNLKETSLKGSVYTSRLQN